MIFGNIGDMFKKVKEMQEGLKKIQEELKSETFEAEAEGVKCVVSGDMEIRDIKIDPKIFMSAGPKKIEQLVKEAVSSAMGEAKSNAMDKMKKLTGGLSIPGLF